MLRHSVGVVLAIGLAAAIFFGGGWGVARMTVLAADGVSLTSIHGLSSLSILLLVGLFLGILMTAPRVSPLSAGLPGLVLLAWTALLGISASLADRLIPLRGHQYATGFHLMLVNGVLALLGIAMIFPLFIPSRWRHGHGEDDEMTDFPATGRLISSAGQHCSVLAGCSTCQA